MPAPRGVMRHAMLVMAVGLGLAACVKPMDPPTPGPPTEFQFGALNGTARLSNDGVTGIATILVELRNDSDQTVWCRREPACSTRTWTGLPLVLQGREWRPRVPMSIGCTFEDDLPMTDAVLPSWQLEPGATRSWTVNPFEGERGMPAAGFVRWTFQVNACLPSLVPPQSTLDYRRGNLKFHWRREAGLRVRLTD